jgi:mediator of RNA polymerase II transcription subunit 5
VAPTICKQSLVACQAGVIDLDTLREGLSYFLQELLSFTLPGVVHWLVGEIGRTPCVLPSLIRSDEELD